MRLDPFARTFLPAAADAGLVMPTISRHLPVLSRCIDPADTVLLVARCARADRILAGDHILVLTRHRLVITRDTRLRRRARLHLDAPLSELSMVTWNRDPSATVVDLAATAIDGVRERFQIRPRNQRACVPVEAALDRVFRRPGRPWSGTAGTLSPAA